MGADGKKSMSAGDCSKTYADETRDLGSGYHDACNGCM